MTNDTQQTPYPIIENARLVDEESVSDFMDTLFSRVRFKPHHFINLRGIGEKGTEKEGKAHFDEWIQPAMEHDPDAHVVDETVRHVKRWAQWHIASFVVPAVLKAARGTSENVELMTAVVVDLDSGDTNAKAAWLEQHIGRPTMAVLSGGTTEAGTPKLHLYWVLEEPEGDIARVIESRHVLAEKVGGDLQFGRGTPQNPLGRAHQPIRIGGSVHAKHGRATTVRVPFYRGPVYEFDLLAEAIRRAPASPWRIVAPQPVLGLDFGPTKNCQPLSTEELMSEVVHEGGEGPNSRWNVFNSVAGFNIHEARKGNMTIEDAKANTHGWMHSNMRPPWEEPRFEREWHALLHRDIERNGMMRQEVISPPTRAIVENATLGIREWATHRWSQGEPEPRKFLVDGLLLAGKAHLLVAEGGAGKTFAMLDLALKVATFDDEERPPQWWGQEVRGGGTVVILTTEDDRGELHIRLHELDADGKRFQAGDRLIVVPLINAGGAFPLVQKDRIGNSASSVRWLETLAHLKGLKDLKLVVLDVLSTTLHGDENNSQVVSEYITALAPVCGELGAALVVTHHIRKQDTRYPIKTPEDMLTAVRGSTGLIGGFRAVLGVWHCHDYARRMQSMGLTPERKMLWRMGVLKANNPEMVRGVKFLLRQPSGALEDATEKAARAISGVMAQREAWLLAAVEAAARAGAPYTNEKKDAPAGLYARRQELHPLLSEDGFGRSGLPAMVESLVNKRALVVRQVRWLAAGGKRGLEKPVLDVPDGPYTQDGHDPVTAGTPYSAPKWERDYRFDEVEGLVVPMDAPRFEYPSADSKDALPQTEQSYADQ